jgi:hypothetical protein
MDINAPRAKAFSIDSEPRTGLKTEPKVPEQGFP